MNKNTIIAVLASFFMGLAAQAQNIWNFTHLEKVKTQLKHPAYSQSYRKLIKDADKLLSQEPVTVMMKKKVAVSGDKHDYLSQARYFWPDPTKPDGLPYINRDGESNPEIYELDRPRLAQVATYVTTLSLAYYFSGDEKYAAKATEMLRAWFLNKETKMNPNLNYSQVVPGRYNGRGRCFGVLDSYSFVPMMDAILLLEQSKSYTAKDRKAIRAWFTQFLDWIVNSDLGQDEHKSKNNHGTAYDIQVIAYANFLGNKKILDKFFGEFATLRINTQIMEDGSQPQELRRTLAFGYSEYNISHIIDVLFMSRNSGIQVGGDSKAVFQKVVKAIDYLTPYLGKPVTAWPYKQISAWNEKQQELCKDIYRASILAKDFGMKAKAKEYELLYTLHAEKIWSRPFNLLFINADRTDNGYASAESQLSYALKCVSDARTKVDNPKKFSPRCTNMDGSLRLVVPRDWCSGFFAGELWQMYQFTHKKEWLKAATEYTLPLDEMRNCTSTHDLGFVVYNSYGRAYKMTGDTAYASVIMDAARSLASRYNDTVHAIRSWDHNRDKWQYPVIIDNLMNLELLFEASLMSGDQSFYNIAVNHAETTLKNHFRPDGSCYHVVSYDPKSGAVEKKNTHQGYNDESVWSRGQAWAIYGYTMCYRYTKRQDFLNKAKDVVRFFYSQENMPEDLIPYWDMRDPKIPNVARDASAAAVIASALYELATYVSKDEAKNYRKTADTILTNLYRNYRAKVKTNYGFLLLHSTGNLPSNDEIDVPISYADYYYLEALWRKDAMK